MLSLTRYAIWRVSASSAHFNSISTNVLGIERYDIDLEGKRVTITGKSEWSDLSEYGQPD